MDEFMIDTSARIQLAHAPDSTILSQLACRRIPACCRYAPEDAMW
jgi:hypothetical protein